MNPAHAVADASSRSVVERSFTKPRRVSVPKFKGVDISHCEVRGGTLSLCLIAPKFRASSTLPTADK